jgi:hypothetical protein
MDKLVELENVLNRPVSSTEDAIANALSVYNEAATQIEAFKVLQDRAKRAIEEVIMETGQDKWETDFARCYITKPGVSVSYDKSALDALCKSDDNLARLLQPHRRETERAGTLTIRRK